MHAPSDDSRPGPASSAGQRGGAAQRGQQLGRVGVLEAGQGQPHRQRVAVQPVQQLPERRPLRAPLRGRERGQQQSGVLGGLGPVQPADRDPADLAQPVLPGPAGDDHRALGMVADPVQELPQLRAAGLVQRRGRPGRVGHLRDRLEVVPHQQPPVLPEQLLHRLQPLGRVQAGEVGAEHAQADRGDHPVQAEGRHAGLERMPDTPAAGHRPRRCPATSGRTPWPAPSSRSRPGRTAPPPAAAGPRSPAGRTGHHGPRTPRPRRPAGPALRPGLRRGRRGSGPGPHPATAPRPGG